MSDLINRQDAIEAIKSLWNNAPSAQHLSAMFDCEDAIRALPSAQPEQKCKSCRYRNLEWYEEPCDSCTMGGEGCHYKPERKKGKWKEKVESEG